MGFANSCIAFIQFEARDKETGKLLALGEHGKAALGTQVRPTTKDGKL